MHWAAFSWHSLYRATAETCAILCLGALTVTCAAAAGATAAGDVSSGNKNATAELPRPLLLADGELHELAEADLLQVTMSSLSNDTQTRQQRAHTPRPTLMDIALQVSAREGLDAMTELYGKIVPDIIRNGQVLEQNHPAALLSQFSASVGGSMEQEMAAYATISATKAFRKNYKHFNDLGRQAHTPRISLRRTALEGLCPPRDPPTCMPASERYRTHDGTCNNKRRPRWGAAQMPFNRFLPPEYGDGVDSIRNSVESGPLSSSRFVSLLVHGAKDGEAGLTLMTAQWGQLLDHDMTSTAQPRSINGSVPSCCGSKDFHPSCFPIKVPLDDPWLSPLKVRCLEFLRSAPAQRRDCILSWREQTNQATSFIDASPIYSNSAKSSDNARVFRNGLLVFGRGNPAEDVCQRGAIATQCIRAGDGRSGEQPGLLAMHHVWVGEHNRIAMELSEMNLHWSDEKLYQETRRIIGAMFQHITYREFLPIILGREVCKLFDLELLNTGYYEGYDPKVNPSVANSFAAAAFRFGHSLVQNSYLRCDRHHNIIGNNVSLHEEFQRGDIGSAGSLHRLLRGMATQRALKRDEFITPELTNHLFQTPGFPFGLDLAAINIQRGRDHGIPPYTAWRVPCGLTPITNWDEFANVVGPESAQRIGHAYRSVHDIDLFVGGIAERPVVGGLVGPTFACILAQQFSNSRKGDRFWYENDGFESAFTPAQLHSIRRVSLAQVMCRAVGGGTFQPHIFIPAEFPGNERLPCGTGPLAPIDLSPWLEQDPFRVPTAPPAPSFAPERVFEIISTDPQSSSQFLKENKAGFSNRIQSVTANVSAIPQKHEPHIDFIPNSASGIQRPTGIIKINDKLDIRQKISPPRRPTVSKPVSGVNNKLDKGPKITLNIKNVHLHRIQTTRRTSVVVNNIPVELRSAVESEGKKTNDNTAKTTKSPTDTVTNTNSGGNLSNIVLNMDKAEARTHDEDDEQRGDNLGHVLNDTVSSTMSTLNAQEPLNEEDLETMTTVAEEDIFDIFSILTEPTKDETTTEIAKTTDTKSNTEETTQISHSSDLSSTTNRPSDLLPNVTRSLNVVDKLNNQTELTNEAHTASNITKRETDTKMKTEPVAERLTSGKNQDVNSQHNSDTTSENTNANITTIITDIDPLSHSLSHEHKRVQRRKLHDRATDTTKHTTKSTTTPSKKHSTLSNTTEPTQRNAELRQYQTVQTFYTRPQKVVVNGPNADQYEIEINIRQTNKKKSSSSRPQPATYPGDYTTVYKPFGFDRYSPHYVDDYYTSTKSPHGYYQPPPKVSSAIPQARRTKPPTVIYLNEHDERTTSRPPGLLQNFITFASSGFASSSRPKPSNSPHSSVQKEKPLYESGVTSIHINSPHSSNLGIATSHYVPRPQSLPSSQSILPISTSAVSLSQVGGLMSVGAVHASSSAISAGNFGSITGVASANGADSTFSFNIRPKPDITSQTALFTPKPSEVGSYGLQPPRKPTYVQVASPEYVSLPVANPAGIPSYYENSHKPSINSPFSTSHKRPQLQTYDGYYSRTQNSPQLTKSTIDNEDVTVNDYDELINSRTLQPIAAKDTSTEDDEDEGTDKTDDYDYDDEHIHVGKKFDRDGYLRPEHMTNALFNARENLTKNGTCKDTNTTLLDDNYVMPVLNITSALPKLLKQLSTPIAITTDIVQLTENVTDFPDVIGKHFSNDILAEDYDDGTTEPFIASKTAALTAMTERQSDGEQGRPSNGVAFAPIKVLTKLERPDNWVIFETPMEKPLLPALPEITVDTSSPTAEIPMPIQGQLNGWFKKPQNKEKEHEVVMISTVTEHDKLMMTEKVTEMLETGTDQTTERASDSTGIDLKTTTVH